MNKLIKRNKVKLSVRFKSKEVFDLFNFLNVDKRFNGSIKLSIETLI